MRTTAARPMAAGGFVGMAAGMAMRAGMAAPSTAAPSAPAPAATTPAITGRVAISLGWLARITWLVRVTGFARLARAIRPAGDLVGRPVKAPDRLAKRLDFALVRGFLALGFLNEFEQFVHRFRGVAQGAERRLDFLQRLANAGRFSRLGRRWRRLRQRLAVPAVLGWRMALARRAGGRLHFCLLESFRRRFGRSHFFGSRREKRLVIGASFLAGIGFGDFRASFGGDFN